MVFVLLADVAQLSTRLVSSDCAYKAEQTRLLHPLGSHPGVVHDMPYHDGEALTSVTVALAHENSSWASLGASDVKISVVIDLRPAERLRLRNSTTRTARKSMPLSWT
jgi:hypothetical protein